MCFSLYHHKADRPDLGAIAHTSFCVGSSPPPSTQYPQLSNWRINRSECNNPASTENSHSAWVSSPKSWSFAPSFIFPPWQYEMPHLGSGRRYLSFMRNEILVDEARLISNKHGTVFYTKWGGCVSKKRNTIQVYLCISQISLLPKTSLIFKSIVESLVT